MDKNCKTCDHKNDPEERWHCRMWVDEPEECTMHMAIEDVVPEATETICYKRGTSWENDDADLLEKLAIAEAALGKISNWFGEFPPTGFTHDDGTELSYGAAWGSYGERDYMRGIALNALKELKETNERKG